MIELIENNKDAILKMCESNHVKQLYVFGSSTHPEKFNKVSDIDFLVSFKEAEISLEEYTESYFNLLFSLEETLNRSIDLTTENSLLNPFFREELEKTKVLLFDALAGVHG